MSATLDQENRSGREAASGGEIWRRTAPTRGGLSKAIQPPLRVVVPEVSYVIREFLTPTLSVAPEAARGGSVIISRRVKATLIFLSEAGMEAS